MKDEKVHIAVLRRFSLAEESSRCLAHDKASVLRLSSSGNKHATPGY